MLKTSTGVEALHRVLFILVVIVALIWTVGILESAQASNLTVINDTLSDSGATVVANHTINFTVPTQSQGVSAGGTITVTFPIGFKVGSVDYKDIDFIINLSDQTLAMTPLGSVWGAVVAGQTLTLTSESGTVLAGDKVTILIGTNAVNGVNQITNPDIGSYEMIVVVGNDDTGLTRVAIIDDALVSNIINSTFAFKISGLATSTLVNGITTTNTTISTAIPFGDLIPGEVKTMAQKLNVVTNTPNGFVVMIEQDGNPQSSTGADIDSFINGAYTDKPLSWTAPTNNIINENTWGHWGVTSDDSDLNSGEFVGTKFIAASTTPRTVFSHSGPADGATQNKGMAEVGYQIEITPLQESEDDYTGSLTYIAMPIF
ncbi:hypothetical protein A2592_02270 [Candidatus Kaiserbacteria bacterium RIFOXYD1_FULL_42_15]|uniref:Uncharacterized protein n=1 Tax=Candidatus Kaiserbacteria bacterium RIFOXYD1_FULL_42_15 TaxID=1798532 RepID=A0A1F6FTD5_9BACT|nr:MAG: hypothetical protein A2592_02270 [Candidatus Kaiserbacteria bacterium RIFOXYD1_FULL_42_15]